MVENIRMVVEDIYTNLLLIAISRKFNFGKLVKESNKEIKNYFDSYEKINFPEGYAGLCYIELLSRKMKSSLGEAYSLSEARKEEIIRSIVDSFDPIERAYENYYYDGEGVIEFHGTLFVLDVSDEKEIMLYYKDLFGSAYESDRDVHAYYNVEFRKSWDTRDVLNQLYYSITISGAGSHTFLSDYGYYSYVVWEGKEGYFADYIDKVIAKHSEMNAKKDEVVNTTENVVPKTDKTVFSISKRNIEVEKPVIESEPVPDGPKVIDELIEYIGEDTKTVSLLDKFEGYGQTDPIRYKRIVIKNVMYKRYGDKISPGFNLVIERGKGLDYVGDVTFTQFKKGGAEELSQYIASEVTNDVVEKYIDKDRFFRFSKPFLLRAQNSSNRTGYGWEWDWSGGYGDYTEGTLYGETTNYFFVGVYVTTGYVYEKSRRKPFIRNSK